MNYEVCLEVVNKLEAVKKLKSQDSSLAKQIAKLMHDHNIMDLKYLNDLVLSLFASQSDKGGGSLLESELTPEGLLTSDFLTNKIAPWVKMVREKLFDSPQAHFQGMNKATKWIEHEALRKLDEKTWEEINQLSERFLEITHGGVTWMKLLPYPGEDGWLKNTPVCPGASLELLADETLKMSKATGFDQASLVMYILADIKPLLVRIRGRKHIGDYHLPTGETLTPRHITLDIWAKDLSFEDLQKIYKGYRRELKIIKGKNLNQKHWEIYQMVKGRGGAPKLREKGSVAFWKTIVKDWNRKHKNKYKSWKGIKITYDRVIAALSSNKGVTK